MAWTISRDITGSAGQGNHFVIWLKVQTRVETIAIFLVGLSGALICFWIVNLNIILFKNICYMFTLSTRFVLLLMSQFVFLKATLLYGYGLQQFSIEPSITKVHMLKGVCQKVLSAALFDGIYNPFAFTPQYVYLY